MRRLLVLFLVIATLVVGASTAHAFNALGHKVVAELAWRGLSPSQRKAIVDTLRRHPRFAEDFIAQMPREVELADQVEQDHWVFQHASTWPDIARGIRGSARSQFDHPTWHYVNGPIYLDPADRKTLAGTLKLNISSDYPADVAESEWNIMQAVQHARHLLKEKDSPAADRALAFCWLFHLVGDAHQPMHSCSLFSASRFPKGDRGGNDIPLLQGGNLHALWDGLAGRSDLMRDVTQRTDQLYDREKYGDVWDNAGKDTNVRHWLRESHDLAKTFAYDDAILQVVRRATPQQPLERIILDAQYLKAAGAHSRGRMIAAGMRLGALLDELVPEGSVELPVAEDPFVASLAPTEQKSAALSHWLNTGTGVRHNISCNWYGKTKHGRLCRPDEGSACGQCGG